MAQRWKDLDDVKGDEHATLVKAREHLSEVQKELGIKPKGKLLQYELFINMFNGKFNPTFGLGNALPGDYHKSLSVIYFAPYTPKEQSDHKNELEVGRILSANRKYDEAKKMISKRRARLHHTHTTTYAP